MSGASRSSATQKPWDIQIPYLEGGFKKAQELFDAEGPKYYDKQTQAKFTGPEKWAHRDIVDYGRGQEARNQIANLRGQLTDSYDRAGAMDTLGAAAQKHGVGVADKVGAYGKDLTGYGGQATAYDLSQSDYAGMTPFQEAQLSDMLAGKVNMGQLKPVVSAMGRDIMGELSAPGGMLAQIRGQQVGYQPGGSSRGDMVTAMAGQGAAQKLADQASRMYADAFSQAQQRRLPAGQMALQAQQAAQQLGLSGAQTRLGAGQLQQQGEGQGIGARTAAGQLQQQAIGTNLSGRGAAGQQGLSALDRAKGVLNAPIGLMKQVGDVGAQQRAWNQEKINQEMAKYNYEGMKDYQGLQNYMSMISGQYGGQSTSTPSPLSSMGQFASLLSGLKSDIRVKENIVPEATHWKGFNVYTFNYIGDDIPRRGVMAQEVERTRPDAVYEIDGVKHVVYGVL